jgi:hypothetical protein
VLVNMWPCPAAEVQETKASLPAVVLAMALLRRWAIGGSLHRPEYGSRLSPDNRRVSKQQRSG